MSPPFLTRCSRLVELSPVSRRDEATPPVRVCARAERLIAIARRGVDGLDERLPSRLLVAALEEIGHPRLRPQVVDFPERHHDRTGPGRMNGAPETDDAFIHPDV